MLPTSVPLKLRNVLAVPCVVGNRYTLAAGITGLKEPTQKRLGNSFLKISFSHSQRYIYKTDKNGYFY